MGYQLLPPTAGWLALCLLLLKTSTTALPFSGHSAFVAPARGPTITGTGPGGDDLPLLFPPRNRPTSLVVEEKGLWVFEQPFITTCDIKTRMSVIKVGKDVIVYSPIAATSNCLAQVKAAVKAEPTHIIMQNNAIDHTLFLSKWKEAFPRAKVLAVAPTSPTDEPLTDGREVFLPPSWRPTLEVAVLDVPFFREVALLHKPSQTLLCADSIWQVKSDRFRPTIVADVGWYLFGVNSVSRFPYWFYNPRAAKENVKSFVDRVSTFDFKRVVTGHLDGIEGAGTKDVFLQSYDYILR